MKLKRRTQPPPQETIVSLIDVIFFLLVFFMLVGRMDATAPFEVSPPVSTAGESLPKGGTTIAVAENGALALDGEAIERQALLTSIRDLLSQNPGLFVRINAHAKARLTNLLPLVTALEQAGVEDVVLVVTPNPV